jgi:hypothetical protein
MYVDESGDPGNNPFGSPFYILSGIVISDNEWQKCLDRLKAFRRSIKNRYGLLMREEIHATELIRVNKLAAYRKIRKSDRICILKEYCSQIPVIFDTAKIINVCLEKANYAAGDIQAIAWNRLIQRFDTYLKKGVKDKGIIISDDTDGKIITQLLRKMRVYNPIPSNYGGAYDAPTDSIIEDVFQRSSHHSYFIQTVDVVAHLLYRREHPKGSLKKFGLEKAFDMLAPIVLKEASKGDPLGIVRK